MDNTERKFTEMVKEYRKTIYTVCYFFSNDKEEVNDLFQEILINLWKGFKDFRGESDIKTWIWRVSLNTCSNQERKKKSSVQTVPLLVDIDLYHDEDEHSTQIQMLYDIDFSCSFIRNSLVVTFDSVMPTTLAIS